MATSRGTASVFTDSTPNPGLHKASNHVDVKRPQRDDSGECVPLETAPKDLSIVATTWLGNVAEGGLDPAG